MIRIAGGVAGTHQCGGGHGRPALHAAAILAPLDLLDMLVFEILLGLAFLRADHAESELGFV